MKKYKILIDHALEHIRVQQSPNGGFISLSSFVGNDFSGAIPRQTTFFTANILSCLENIPGAMDDMADTKERAVKFLLAQKSAYWSVNYWSRDSTERTEFPYPDDLDDTFAMLIALTRHDPAMIDGHVFSAIAKMLIAQEVKEGGPYRTWIVSANAPAKWQDVDLVVNSTIGYFLSLIGIRLSQLECFINNAVQRDQLKSPYYPDIFHVGYFVSRFYKNNRAQDSDDSMRAKLADILIARLHNIDGKNITALEYAMAISSLTNLGYREEVSLTAADCLATQLERDGFLPYSFCIDPSRDGRQCYGGASALTAAFCAEALILAQLQHPSSNRPPVPTVHDHIRSLARTSCHDIGPDLRASAIIQIEKISDEKISSLAYEFRDVLLKNGKIVPHNIVEALSLANLYGWMAYSIYDDALDAEGDPALLPCANFFLRALIKIYVSLEMHIPDLLLLFNEIMNRIDGTNAWEQKHCRISTESREITTWVLPQFGDHGILADRSIGYAMGPLAELLYVGYPVNSKEYKTVELFFQHYLIARQLHDDAHDWADDLLRGCVNSVGTLLLSCFIKKETTNNRTLTVLEMIPELQKIFWRGIVNQVADMIIFHIDSARQAREKSHLLSNTNFMENTLRDLEMGAHRAVKERDDALVFLKDYKDFPPSGVRQKNPLSYE